jgi:hypothetical protein
VGTALRRIGPGRLAIAAFAICALAAGAVVTVLELTGEQGGQAAPAPRVVVRGGGDEEERPEAAAELGFPAFATKNTTRVGGPDATSDAAGIALAIFPSQGGVEGPPAVTFVPASDWALGIAASALVGDPIRAPVLISETDEVPAATLTALAALRPEGSAETGDAQAFRIGDVEVPAGLRTTGVGGRSPAEVAAGIDRLRQRLTGEEPQHIVLASAEEAGFAMPAAAWAARSGDPVLFVRRDSVPKPTLEALERHRDAPVFLLGPESAASEKVEAEVERVAPAVQRIAGEDPVTNAIEFARFEGGSFGWNINDPGHGLVIASTSRPLDAAAAAPLSASGKWGPLLVTETADLLSAPLRGYLLDIKPGYRSDPTRAFYNHAWLIGDDRAISVSFQAQVDELLELTKVQRGTGEPLGEAEGEGQR